MVDSPLEVRTLTLDQIEQAYTLIGSCSPFVSLADWRQFATRLIRSDVDSPCPSGVVAAVNPAGRLRGTYSFWTKTCPQQHERLLVVAHLAIPLLGRRRVAEVLRDQMMRTAIACCCKAIHAQVFLDCEWNLAFFKDCNYEVEIIPVGMIETGN